VVLPWSTWAMIAMLRMAVLMGVKRLETKIAAETTSSPDETLSSSNAGVVYNLLF